MTRVLVFPEGENSSPVIAVDWENIQRSEAAYQTDLTFTHPLMIRKIKIDMKGPIHEYFGISRLSLVGAGETVNMIVSGMTSVDEMCLQVAAGKKVEGNRVELDSCVKSMAAGDGRELFKYTHTNQLEVLLSDPPLCVAVASGKVIAGEKLVIQDCIAALREQDGRSTFKPTSNSQIRLVAGNGRQEFFFTH
eukprot:GHVR01055776.1.p2 GENE.GHVR01055776.1~~GHVR01055776.1.p2  ORF type:complete len:192 (+),score=19.61 GHVR01055776.1:471-1046(+)